MDAVVVLRTGYLGAALAVILVSVIPSLRDRFLAYGPRASAPVNTSPAGKEKNSRANRQSLSVSRVLDLVASWKVPHAYFWTFYLLSTSLSFLWLSSYVLSRERGGTLRTSPTRKSMTFEQVKNTWILMLIQGSRRLYECLSLEDRTRKTSEMWIGHWVLGLLFYTATSIAVWIEGVPMLITHKLGVNDIYLRDPSIRTILSVLVFILASGFQHDCHAYLAGLKKSKSEDGKGKPNEYKIPTHPAFHSLIAPHYAAECVIYLSLAMLAAPPGAWLNWTLASALVFVAVNLGVTAAGTRQWYRERFGATSVQGKWNMIPYAY